MPAVSSEIDRTRLDSGFIEVTDAWRPGHPAHQFSDVAPLGAPFQVFLVMFLRVPVFNEHKIVGVFLIRVDGDGVATVETTSVNQLISQKICQVLGVGGVGGAF